MRAGHSILAIALMLAIPAIAASQPTRLTLKDAEEQAARNHPRILAGELDARAAGETVREARSAYFPVLSASATGAEALDPTRIAAGSLSNPTILDRFAYGVAGSQLITDFGRTSALAGSASLRADAERQDVADLRAIVRLQVDRAYFDALRAQAVLKVANETVTARQLVVDQATELAAAGLKSSLDVSFATVNLSEARLLVLQAGNDAQASFAVLSTALGAAQSQNYELDDTPIPAAPPSDSAALIAAALRDRHDLARERFAQQAQARLASAEHDLSHPTISMAGAAGLTPFHEAGIDDRYAAVGVNVTFPLANGGLYAARQADAEFRAQALGQSVRDLEARVARDVRVAWLAAETSFNRLDLTSQLLNEATDGLDLAQQRYGLGISSIVELTQAQLALTRAQIEQATARYDYETKAAELRFETGAAE
jgi:outer membrane protein